MGYTSLGINSNQLTIFNPQFTLGHFQENFAHILSKYVGQYVGLDLTFCHKNVHTYVTYVCTYTPNPLQTAIYVLEPVLEISRYPPMPPLIPLDLQPPTFWESLPPTKGVPHT